MMNIANQNLPVVSDTPQLKKQHFIDPETCLRCGSCQSVCPEGAIKLDITSYQYAIDPDRCTNQHECLTVCSSDAIKSWRMVPENRMYTVQEQLSWEYLPPELQLEGHPLVTLLDEDELTGKVAPASHQCVLSSRGKDD